MKKPFDVSYTDKGKLTVSDGKATVKLNKNQIIALSLVLIDDVPWLVDKLENYLVYINK